MKKMKRAALCIFLLIFAFGMFSTHAAAEGVSDNTISAADYLPQEVLELLRENGFKKIDLQELVSMTPQAAFSALTNSIKAQLDTPFVVMYALFFVLIVVALFSGIGGEYFASETQTRISIIGILCVCAIAAAPVMECLIKARQTITQLSDFIRVFVPAYAGVLLMSGRPATAGAYQTAMIFCGEAVCRLLSGVVLPLLYLYLAFTIVGRATHMTQTEKMAACVKSAVIWCLSLTMTLFVSFVTIKGIVGNSADSVSLRAGKFLVGSFVPAVGGALSEAAGNVFRGLGIIQKTTGVFGIVASAVCFLPSLIHVLIYKFTCDITAAIGDILGSETVSGLLHDVSTVFGLIAAVILSYGAVTILTTALMLSMGG